MNTTQLRTQTFVFIGLFVAFAILAMVFIALYASQRKECKCDKEKTLLGADGILYINLDHRQDRRKEIEDEIAKWGWTHLSKRVSAVKHDRGGWFGCLLSHVKTLEYFLRETNWRTLLVLEDDAMFVHDPREQLHDFLNKYGTDDWDVLMLASWNKVVKPHDELVDKVHEAITTAAFMITRPFAETLLNHWKASVDTLTKNPSMRDPCDETWTQLQPQARWFVFANKPAKQRPSFSDIRNEDVINDF